MDEKLLLGLAVGFMKSQRGSQVLSNLKDKLTNDPQNEPIITTFVTKGRIYDQQTNEPLQGVDIKFIELLYPMKSFKNDEGELEYKLDEDSNKEVKTDSNGEFEIRFGVPVLPSLPNVVLGQPKLAYTIDNYAPQQQTIVTGNGEVLSELPPIGLVNIELAAEIAAAELKNEANKVIQKVSSFVLDPIERSIVVVKNSVLTVTSSIQNKLFPLAIGLLVIFGITKLAQSGEEKCPSNALLKLAIQRRNSIVKQLNNIYKVIAVNTALVAVFLAVSAAFKAGKLSIFSTPAPTVVYPIVAALEGIKELFDKFEKANKDLRKALIIALVFLIASLVIILRYLKKIDELIERCAGENEGLEMTEINNELLAIGKESVEQGNPVVTNVNGFEISVEVDQQSKTGELYKRRAIGKNSAGVTILKGDGSFSAEDQILIDELSFYIVQNNLKAD
tara:strand:+ start:1084 stop:2424 length:1341 start_codon:yes stop_codon:yes gene_type:complete